MDREETERKGAEHQTEGAAKEARGKIQKNVADLTGNRSGQAEGALREAAGKVQKKAGEAARKKS